MTVEHIKGRLMIKMMILAGVMFVRSASAADSQDIQFVSSDAFTVMATAKGSAVYDPPFLKVALQDAVLRKNPKLQRVDRVTGYRIGVAFDNGTLGWDTKRWSNVVRLDEVMLVDRTVDLKNPVVRIPIDGISLRGSWLVFEVEIANDNGTVGTTYAHSNKLQFP
jgi:hypothetical protein